MPLNPRLSRPWVEGASHPAVVTRRAKSAQGRFGRAACFGGRPCSWGSGPVFFSRGRSGRAEWQASGGRSCEFRASFGRSRLVGEPLTLENAHRRPTCRSRLLLNHVEHVDDRKRSSRLRRAATRRMGPGCRCRPRRRIRSRGRVALRLGCRGDDDGHSDIDLLIVLDSFDPRDAIDLKVRAFKASPSSAPFDVSFTDPGRYKARSQTPGTIERAAVLDGRCLYQRD